jgi:hypothetical protein
MGVIQNFQSLSACYSPSIMLLGNLTVRRSDLPSLFEGTEADECFEHEVVRSGRCIDVPYSSSNNLSRVLSPVATVQKIAKGQLRSHFQKVFD